MKVSTLGSLVLYLQHKAWREGRFKSVYTPALNEEIRLAGNVVDAAASLRARGENPYTLDADVRDWLLIAEDTMAGILGASLNTTGVELRGDRASSDMAQAIRAYATRHLASLHYETFLASVEELGYTKQNLRAALRFHWTRLGAEKLDDNYCIYVDIRTAAEDAPPDYKAALKRLMAGIGPQAIGEELGLNGSRLVGKALAWLSSKLEGQSK